MQLLLGSGIEKFFFAYLYSYLFPINWYKLVQSKMILGSPTTLLFWTTGPSTHTAFPYVNRHMLSCAYKLLHTNLVAVCSCMVSSKICTLFLNLFLKDYHKILKKFKNIKNLKTFNNISVDLWEVLL